MKKIYLFLFSMLFLASFGWGQGSESFDNLDASGSTYEDGSYTGDNGLTWNYGLARKITSTYTITGTTLGFKDAGNRYVNATVSGGIGSVTYSVRSYFTGGNASDRTIELWVDGSLEESYTLAAMGTVYTRTVNNINVTGEIILEFKSTGTKQIALDDVSWTGFSGSGPDNPTDFTATPNSTSQIDLSWTDNGDGDFVLLAFNTSDSFGDPTDGTTYSNGDNLGGATVLQYSGTDSYSHTGLNSSTTYYYKAWSYDGAEYSSGVTANATTLSAPITSYPYTQGFEGDFLPEGWTQYSAGDENNGWVRDEIEVHTGTYSAYHQWTDDFDTDADDWLISPPFDLSGVDSPKLTYWDFVDYAGDADEHNVMYSTNYPGYGDPSDYSWTNINTVIGTEDTWVENGEYSLPTNSSLYIAFQYTGAYTSGWNIDDIEIRGTLPEPTNHPTNLIIAQGSPNTSVLEMIWDDAVGGILPEAYLIKGSDVNMDAIVAPVDGTEEADDGLVLNVDHGDESAEFTGLDPNTRYFFKVFPYTNSGSDIDYKTNGVVLSEYHGTFGVPVAIAADGLTSTSFTANWEAVEEATSYRLDVSEYEDFEIPGGNMTDLIISEYVEGSSSNKYIEIYNGTGSDVTLTGTYELRLYSNGSTSVSNTQLLTGTLSNNTTLVFENSSATIYGGSATSSSVCNFNGNDAVSLAKNGTNIDVVGTIGSSSTFGQDVTLTRKSSIDSPNSTYTSAEWNSSSQDDVSDLGSHTFSGGSTPSFVAGYNDLTVTGNSQSVTGLSASTTYYYRVRAYDGSVTTDNSNTITATTSSATAGLWTGATSNDWHTSTNWDDGSVPGATIDVVIPAGLDKYPTIGSAANCKSLTLKSDASGDASLIGQSYLTIADGDATVERYISPYSGSSDGWHFISSPVNSMTIAGSDFVTGTFDLYRWAEDEVTEYRWYNYEGGSFSQTEFENGLGYLFAHATGGVFEFTGALNSGSYEKDLDYNADRGDGWNLIGNPFPSAIDADALAFSNANTGVYVVNPSNGSYMAHNGDFGHPALANGHIPINQGFFVQATGSSATVTMTTAAQVHSTNDFNKHTQSLPAESIMVTLSGQNSDSYTFLGFRDNSSMNFDGNYDAYELFGWATMAQVYTEIEDVQYSINCLPHSEETISVPLCISVQSDEELTLNFSGMETFYNTVKIELEDKQLGFTQNITNNPVYTFDASTQDDENRFLLHFNGVTGVEDIAGESNIQVYSVDDMIYINSLENLSADILVYNINGQLIYNEQMNAETLKRISLGTSSGVYLVNIITEESSATHKVYVK